MVWIVTVAIAQATETTEVTKEVRILSYNVENLFDCQHDTLKNDSSFLPTGTHNWTYKKYQTKLDRIAQVIVNIAGWESVPIVGLCEVENNHCLKDLCYLLKRFHYQYIHYESPDERGMDVALLYDNKQVEIIYNKALSIPLVDDYTRDVLYACCVVNNSDTIHTMVCHLPSQLGGSTNTEHKRLVVKKVIQNQIDSILNHNAQAQIIVMGDMNNAPMNDLMGMRNKMIEEKQGTHKFQGIWTCLDQFYVSESMEKRTTARVYTAEWLMEEDRKYLDMKPKRTYVGYSYQGGYSDHLPIILTIKPER